MLSLKTLLIVMIQITSFKNTHIFSKIVRLHSPSLHKLFPEIIIYPWKQLLTKKVKQVVLFVIPYIKRKSIENQWIEYDGSHSWARNKDHVTFSSEKSNIYPFKLSIFSLYDNFKKIFD